MRRHSLAMWTSLKRNKLCSGSLKRTSPWFASESHGFEAMKSFLVLPFALSLGITLPAVAFAETNGLSNPPGANGAGPAASGNSGIMGSSTPSASSATASRKSRERDEGLSTDPDECVKHGCVGNNH